MSDETTTSGDDGGKLHPDEQLAAVITFQRNAFGNETGDTAQPADIAGAR